MLDLINLKLYTICMEHKINYRIFIRDDGKRCPASLQKREGNKWLETIKDGTILPPWDFPDKNENLELMKEDARPTDVIGVYHLYLLAPRGRGVKRKPSQALLDHVVTIFKEGAFLYEISSGRMCDNLATFAECFSDARDRLAGLAVGTKAPPGRKKVHKYTNEEIKKILDFWKYDTRTIAEKEAVLREYYPSFHRSIIARKDGPFQTYLKEKK